MAPTVARGAGSSASTPIWTAQIPAPTTRRNRITPSMAARRSGRRRREARVLLIEGLCQRLWPRQSFRFTHYDRAPRRA